MHLWPWRDVYPNAPRTSLSLIDPTKPNTAPDEITYRKAVRIFGEGEPSEYVYQVTRGMVLQSTSLADGRRQVNSFNVPGDFVGLEEGNIHRFTAETVVETSVRVIARQDLEARAKA